MISKRFIYICLSAVLSVLVLNQAILRADAIGLRLGTQRLDTENDYFKLKAGVYYSFQISDQISIQPEIALLNYTYDYIGITYYDNQSGNKHLRYYDNLRFIEVPVLLKYCFPLKGDLKPVLLAGGYASFRLTEKVPEYESDQNRAIYNDLDSGYSEGFWGDFEVPLIREYASVDWGIILGIGVEHGIGKTRLSFDVRFNIGLNDIVTVRSAEYDNYKNSNPIQFTKRNQSISFNIGLSFL